MTTQPDDAVVLERSAEILRSRSSKPRSVLLAAICRVLTSTAGKIRAELAGSQAEADEFYVRHGVATTSELRRLRFGLPPHGGEEAAGDHAR